MAALSVFRMGERPPVWRTDHFSWYVDYLASDTSQVQTDANRKNTLITLSRETAERAFALMTAGF